MNKLRLAYEFFFGASRCARDATKYTTLVGLFSFLSLGRALRTGLGPFQSYQNMAMPRQKKFAIAGGSLFCFGIIFGWAAFPSIIKSQIKKQVVLKPGTDIREMWTAFPLPIDFKIYLFNVTNADEIKEGKKPILQEVGPYFFDEYKEKLNLIDREEDDTVEYSRKDSWFFNPSKSNGLTGEEELVFPHLFIIGLILATLREKPTAIGIASKAVDSIFKKPSSVFVKAKAMDIMFNGLPVDCTVKDFAGSAVCAIIKTEAKDLQEVEEDVYKFSLFGSKNATAWPERYRVLRGIKNYKDVGRVTEWNNQPALDIWPEDHCNAYNGTDSTIFPPLMSSEDDIVSFAPELCRSLGARFVAPSKVKGISTLYYTADLGDMSTDPALKCFCPTPETCLGKNLYDLTKCVGIPLIASLPHLYESDPKLIAAVEGLHPSRDKHEICMDFEPMTATPLQARKRLQFNMQVFPIEKFKLMKNFPDVLFPLFWVEEGLILDDSLVKQLKDVFMIISIVTYVKWLMVIMGIGFGGSSIYMHVKNRGNEQKLEITKVSPQGGSGKQSGEEKKWQTMNISTIQAATVPANIDRN